MATRKRSAPSDQAPSWKAWKGAHAKELARANEAQRTLLEAGVRFVRETEGQAMMVRVAAFFLLHADMGLTPAQVGAAIGRTDRAMRTVQTLSAREFLDSVWNEMGRHRKPKLSADHAGPIALYLVDHPGCSQGEMVSFIDRSLGIKVDPQTLRRFFKTYGLGVLREDSRKDGTEARPFDSGARTTEGRFSSFRRRSR